MKESSSVEQIPQKNQRELEVEYLQNQLKSYDAYQAMILAGKESEGYQELKKKWQQAKEKARKGDEEMKTRLSPEEWEKYQEDHNRSKANALAKLRELGGQYLPEALAEQKPKETASEASDPQKEPPKEIEKVIEKKEKADETVRDWKPLGIWGNKDPRLMTLEEKKKYLKLAQSSGPLAVAYWENEIKNTQEQSARQEAETHRAEVKKLEKETEELAAEERSTESKEEGIFEEPKEKRVGQLERAAKAKEKEKVEIEKKASWGQRFKAGVKRWFNKFKKENTKEDKKEAEKEKDQQKKISELEKDITKLKQEKEQKLQKETKEVVPETIPVGEREEEEGEKKDEDKIRALEDQKRDQQTAGLEEEIARLRKEKEEKLKEAASGEEGSFIEDEYRRQEKDLRERIRAVEDDKKGLTGRKIWGFFKERLKGTATLGYWEHYKAGQFRQATGTAGKEMSVQARVLEQEKGLLKDDEAREEAQEVEAKLERERKDWIENYGADPKEARDLAARFLGAQISQRKKEYNQTLEDKMIALALKKLEDELKNKNWIEKYKKALTGTAVITPERMQELEKRMREQIGKLRRGQEDRDSANFKKLIRQSLDKWWWTRHVFGAIESILGFMLLKWIAAKYFGEAAASAGGGAGAAAEGGEKAVEAAGSVKDGIIWPEAEKLLAQAGIEHPTASQIKEVSISMAKENGVKVVTETGELLWPETVGGTIKDIAQPSGFMLKLAAGAKKAAALASVFNP